MTKLRLYAADLNDHRHVPSVAARLARARGAADRFRPRTANDGFSQLLADDRRDEKAEL